MLPVPRENFGDHVFKPEIILLECLLRLNKLKNIKSAADVAAITETHTRGFHVPGT
jgi:hypothetical protein